MVSRRTDPDVVYLNRTLPPGHARSPNNHNWNAVNVASKTECAWRASPNAKLVGHIVCAACASDWRPAGAVTSTVQGPSG